MTSANPTLFNFELTPLELVQVGSLKQPTECLLRVELAYSALRAACTNVF